MVCMGPLVHTVLSNGKMRLAPLLLMTTLPDPDSVAPPLHAISVLLPALFSDQVPLLTTVPLTAEELLSSWRMDAVLVRSTSSAPLKLTTPLPLLVICPPVTRALLMRTSEASAASITPLPLANVLVVSVSGPPAARTEPALVKFRPL